MGFLRCNHKSRSLSYRKTTQDLNILFQRQIINAFNVHAPVFIQKSLIRLSLQIFQIAFTLPSPFGSNLLVGDHIHSLVHHIGGDSKVLGYQSGSYNEETNRINLFSQLFIVYLIMLKWFNYEE